MFLIDSRNFFGIFRRKEPIPEIDMYCQSPLCNRQITEDESVFVLSGDLVHQYGNCVLSHHRHTINEGRCQTQMDILPISYENAARLANEGRVKYGQLEEDVINEAREIIPEQMNKRQSGSYFIG